MQRVTAWLRRYLPAEIGGTLGACLGAWLAVHSTGHLAVGAIGGTWGEATAYYLTVLVRDLRAREQGGIPVLRGLILEFGPAEAVDSLLVRPLLLYRGLLWAPHPLLGLLAGKVAADLAFYVPTIISYELQRARTWRATEGQHQ